MAVISRIKAWTNPGFTEGGPKAPRDGHSLPNPDIDLSVDVHPSADRMFSELRLPVPFDEWRSICYLQITYEWTNESSTVYCGWVDSVDCISDSDSAAVTAVKWHVDEWGTWLGTAVLGYGHVLRRPTPTESSTPIQGYSPKYWVVNQRTVAVPHKTVNQKESWWVIVAAAYTSSNKYVSMVYYTWPISKDGSCYGKTSASGSSSVPFITGPEVFAGNWDEMLGISPERIYGAWIVPCPPMGAAAVPNAGTSADPLLNALPWTITTKTTGSITRCFYSTEVNTITYYNQLFPESASVNYSTLPTERNPVHVLGFDGSSVLQLPYGFSLSSYKYRVVASATSCAIELRFDGTDSRMEGVCASIPAVSLDLTENAWSEYVYSGQREWEVESRWNESWKKGTESLVGGATTGALMGGLGPAGAVAGAATGSVGGLTSLATDFLWYNEATKGLKDDLMSKQSPGILLQGNPWDVVYYGDTIVFARMSMDNYSATRVSNERSRIGVKVDEYIDNNSSVKTSTGFYQIVNLEVNGSIPNSAKRFIANRFAQGVILI